MGAHRVTIGRVGGPSVPAESTGPALTHLTVPHDEELLVDGDVGVLKLQQWHQLWTRADEVEVWGRPHLSQLLRPGQGQGPGRAGGPEVRSQMAQGESCLQDVLAVLCGWGQAPRPLRAAQPHLERAVPVLPASWGDRRTR